MTDDPTHAVAVARLGDVDAITQQRVSAQPYTVGVLFSSSNRLSWTPHQETDLHFQIVAAKFTADTATFTLWTGAFATISDVLVRGTIEIPTDDARFKYEIVRASGARIALASGQNYAFSES